jgi:hypothetical protein
MALSPLTGLPMRLMIGIILSFGAHYSPLCAHYVPIMPIMCPLLRPLSCPLCPLCAPQPLNWAANFSAQLGGCDMAAATTLQIRR